MSLIKEWKQGNRRLMFAVVSLLWAVALAACATPTPPPEPVTIQFSYPLNYWGSPGHGYYEPLVEAFGEEHGYVTVDLRPEGWGEHYDVFADPEWWVQRTRLGAGLHGLDALVERDVSFDLADFYPTVVDLFAAGGELWAVPFGLDVLVVYYNRDLFDAYDVPYPEAGWTWSDFLDRALALRDPDNKVFGYVPNEDYLDAIAFVYQHGGRLVDDLEEPTRATLDEPLNVEALEWYADLIHRHDVAPTPAQARSDFGMGVDDPRIGVVLGQVGMWMGPLSDQGSDIPWGFRWGMAPLPSDAQAATLAWGWGYAIMGDSVSPDACWEWITFLSERMPERLVPACISLAESEEFGRLPGSEAARASLEGMTLVPFYALWGWDEEQSARIFGSAMSKIVGGSASVQEALSTAQEISE